MLESKSELFGSFQFVSHLILPAQIPRCGRLQLKIFSQNLPRYGTQKNLKDHTYRLRKGPPLPGGKFKPLTQHIQTNHILQKISSIDFWIHGSSDTLTHACVWSMFFPLRVTNYTTRKKSPKKWFVNRKNTNWHRILFGHHYHATHWYIALQTCAH